MGSCNRSVNQYRDVGSAGLVLRPAWNSRRRSAEPFDRGILLEALFPVPKRLAREAVDICENVCETYSCINSVHVNSISCNMLFFY